MRFCVMALVGALAGCSTSPPPFFGLDMGGPDAFALPTPDVGPPPPHDAAIGDLAGDHWDGTIDAAAFPSGSNRVRIFFDRASGDGPRTGLVTFGAGPAFPLPTTGDVGYPPGYPLFQSADPRLDRPAESFSYPIENGALRASHLHIDVNELGVWEP